MLPMLRTNPLSSETPGVKKNGTCPPGQYSCFVREACYTEEQKCDGHSDCPQSQNTPSGEDEEDCTSGDGDGSEGGEIEAEKDDSDPSWLNPAYLTDLLE